jgi:SAM-dependent methyltransferase
MTLVQDVENRLMFSSRERKIRQFYSLFDEGQSVLDVGVTRETRASLARQHPLNHFLRTYRYAPETYTGLAVQNIDDMERLFPGKHFVCYSGGRFPFEARTFDWTFSNAVIEHVGNREAQLLFVNELMRVADNAFFTTPNRYFPIESHTHVAFLHWNDRVFRRWRERHRPLLELELLSRRDLEVLLQHSTATGYQIQSNRLAGVTMTFSVVCTSRQKARAT